MVTYNRLEYVDIYSCTCREQTNANCKGNISLFSHSMDTHTHTTSHTCKNISVLLLTEHFDNVTDLRTKQSLKHQPPAASSQYLRICVSACYRECTVCARGV